jgi:hypothetical protein
MSALDRRLGTVRGRDRLRWALTAAAVLVGVALVTVHWLGLVLGGALVGVLQRGLGRAILAGLAFGVVALLAFLILAARLEPGELLALRPVVYVTVGAGLGLPLLGSLVRGVV